MGMARWAARNSFPAKQETNAAGRPARWLAHKFHPVKVFFLWFFLFFSRKKRKNRKRGERTGARLKSRCAAWRGSIPPVQVDDAAVDGVDCKQGNIAVPRHFGFAGVGDPGFAVNIPYRDKKSAFHSSRLRDSAQ